MTAAGAAAVVVVAVVMIIILDFFSLHHPLSLSSVQECGAITQSPRRGGSRCPP